MGSQASTREPIAEADEEDEEEDEEGRGEGEWKLKYNESNMNDLQVQGPNINFLKNLMNFFLQNQNCHHLLYLGESNFSRFPSLCWSSMDSLAVEGYNQ